MTQHEARPWFAYVNSRYFSGGFNFATRAEAIAYLREQAKRIGFVRRIQIDFKVAPNTMIGGGGEVGWRNSYLENQMTGEKFSLEDAGVVIEPQGPLCPICIIL
jgi:hypothetical protein